MRCLITGGAGFIGGHLAEALLNEGHQVTVIDDLSTGRLTNLETAKAHPDFKFVKGDVADLPELNCLIAETDVIFHLAAAVGVELVVSDPVRTINTNVHGTEKILRGADRHGKKVFMASTSEVYGRSPKETFSETDDLLIGPSNNARWSYACSKLLDEFLAMAYHRDADLPVVIVRFFNTVGPRQTGRYGMVIPRFVAKALAGEPIQVYGDGSQTRCFCHVADTVRALMGLKDCPEAVGKIINIGGVTPISIGELAEKVRTQLGSESPIEAIPYFKAYEEGFEDMRHRVPDTSVVSSLIGWKANLNLDEIINDVAHYQKNSGLS